MLRIFSHVIYFVQNDKFHTDIEHVFRANKLIDLVTDDVDAAFVRGVQMNHQILIDFVVFGLIFVDEIHDGGCFAGAGRTVEEQIGEIVFGQYVLEELLIDGVEYNIVELYGPVLFYPGNGGRIFHVLLNTTPLDLFCFYAKCFTIIYKHNYRCFTRT